MLTEVSVMKVPKVTWPVTLAGWAAIVKATLADAKAGTATPAAVRGFRVWDPLAKGVA